MAIRLPVVLAQHAKRNASFTDCEESWITSLLFEERLDATLVSDLMSIQLDSTDYLCLAGLKGDFVLVSWEDSATVLRELVRLGFESFEIIPVDGSARVSSPVRHQSVKKIYLMGFNRGVAVSQLVGQLKGLLESKSTPVFQLQIAPKSVASHTPKQLPVLPLTSATPIVAPSTMSSHSTSHTHAQSGAPEMKSRSDGASFQIREPLPNGISNANKIAYEDGDDFPHIDSLVDELDRFDS